MLGTASSSIAGHYLELWDAFRSAATMAERHAILVTLITPIVCDPDRKRLVSITPKPVFAPFFRHQAGLQDRGDGAFDFVGER